jgi:hypothetical protein
LFTISIRLRYNLSAWSAITVVLNRIEPTTKTVPIIARYAKNLGIARKATNANSGSVASAAHQDTQHPNVLNQHATNAAARLTKALRASRVLNTSAPIAKARSNRRDTTETTALEWKPRYATNAAKPATARTNAPFVHAMHVAFEITNYKPAICVPNTCALCVTARKNQKVTTTLYAHVLSAKHASFSAMWRKTAHTQIVWTSRTIGLTFCSPNAKAS